MKKDERELIQGQKAIADRLNISERTLRNWLRSDDPPPVWRLHGVWCAYRDDLQKWTMRRAKAEA